jgi:probable rRNA maturation factor
MGRMKKKGTKVSESASPKTGNLPSEEPATGEIEGPIVVQVDEEFEAEVDPADLVAAVAAALAAQEQAGEVTVVITTDEAVADLNKQYRDTDGPTDVLSFPAQDSTPGFVVAPEMDAYLGDIIIALPYTRRQAESLGRKLRDELRLLAVHGILHLLGYDHAEPEEEAEMWARQDAILASLP